MSLKPSKLPTGRGVTREDLVRRTKQIIRGSSVGRRKVTDPDEEVRIAPRPEPREGLPPRRMVFSPTTRFAEDDDEC